MNRLVKILSWDSEFFDLPIGQITSAQLDNRSIEQMLAEAHSLGLRCLYFTADPNDRITVKLAEQHHFHLVDVRIVLEHPFRKRPAPVPRYPISPQLVIGPPLDSELPHLQDIAAQIGHTSRFHFDTNFGPDQSERLYRLWIANACRGFADAVFIARWHEQGEAVGLITCTLRHDISHIQLAGVHADHRQHGVGTGLVQAALDWAKGQGAVVMEVVTQARNVPAQRLYQQMGFFTQSMSLYYHKWL